MLLTFWNVRPPWSMPGALPALTPSSFATGAAAPSTNFQLSSAFAQATQISGRQLQRTKLEDCTGTSTTTAEIKTSCDRSIDATPVTTKKRKIFRPWDDDDDDHHKDDKDNKHRTDRDDHDDQNAAEWTSVSRTASGGTSLIREPVVVRAERSMTNGQCWSFGGQQQSPKKLATDPNELDELDQSKTAFEMFATNLGKSPDGHRCIYCGKVYSRKYGLKIHLRTHTGFKPLKCKVCQRPFGDPSNLNKHVRLHADVLQAGNHDRFHHPVSVFRCPFCGRSLVRKRDLERHLASRHPDEQLIDVERE